MHDDALCVEREMLDQRAFRALGVRDDRRLGAQLAEVPALGFDLRAPIRTIHASARFSRDQVHERQVRARHAETMIDERPFGRRP